MNLAGSSGRGPLIEGQLWTVADMNRKLHDVNGVELGATVIETLKIFDHGTLDEPVLVLEIPPGDERRAVPKMELVHVISRAQIQKHCVLVRGPRVVDVNTALLHV